MIKATVAMPLYNMGQIAELALEGLCKQKTQHKWELIIIEEQTENMLSFLRLMDFEARLHDAGCENIIYIPLDSWIPLGQKWKEIARKAGDSKCFLLQAGDCYSHHRRIENTVNAFEQEKCNFYDEVKGLWYSFRLNKTVIWQPSILYTHPCMLNMAWRTDLVKQLPDNNRKINIDMFLYTELSKIEKIKALRNTKPPLTGVDTDGYNTISNRDKLLSKVPNIIFQPTTLDALEVVPELNKYKNRSLNKRFKDV